jgi:hypothetical protein
MTAEEEAILRSQIKEAEKAHHDLLIGASVRTVRDQNGQYVEFTQAKRADLAAYIQSLKAALPGASATGAYGSGPIGFIF